MRLTLGLYNSWNYIHAYYVWQSRVEIKHYSVAYFDHVTALQVLKCRTLVKGSYVLCKCGTYYRVYPLCMSPALNESSALQYFKHSNTMKIHDRIMFNFYPRLPHIQWNLS